MEVMILRVKTSWRVRTLGILIGLLLLLGVPMAAQADSVSLTWNPNTEEDLAGYKVYVGTMPAAYTDVIDVGHVTTYTIFDLVPGETYFFAVTAYDIFANESNYSTEASIAIYEPPPPAPEDTTTPTSEDEATTASSEDKSTAEPDNPNTWFGWFWNLMFG